jgi:transcriptional accessory protein Tex/SPT6
VPKVPGQPIRDMSGKPIAGNVQLADKKEPTESQANAYTYYSRMEESDKIIRDLNGKYDPYKINIKTSGKTALIPGGQDVANYFLSENDQKVEQAQRNFINAVLRRESGATIQPSEFDSANQQYFDQPNDKPGVLKQKAANRKTAIEGIKRAAGPSIKKASQDGQSNVVNFEDLQ